MQCRDGIACRGAEPFYRGYDLGREGEVNGHGGKGGLMFDVVSFRACNGGARCVCVCE